MVNFKQINIEQHVLTVEGTQIAQSGSHEFRVWAALPPPGSEAGLTAQQIGEKVGKDVAKVGQGKAMKNKWVAKKGDGFLQAVRRSSPLSLSLLYRCAEADLSTSATGSDSRRRDAEGPRRDPEQRRAPGREAVGGAEEAQARREEVRPPSSSLCMFTS